MSAKVRIRFIQIIRAGLCFGRSYSSMQDCRGIYVGCPTVLSSPSSEELTQDQGDRVSLDAADSGRGSWTSCSSGSHDNIQTMQQGRSWETLAFGGGGSMLPPGGPEALLGGPAALWAAQARGSWASASSSSSSAAYWGEDSEGDTGTIKRRGGKDVSADPETSSITSTGSEEAKLMGRPTPSPITAGGKGLLCEWLLTLLSLTILTMYYSNTYLKKHSLLTIVWQFLISYTMVSSVIEQHNLK